MGEPRATSWVCAWAIVAAASNAVSLPSILSIVLVTPLIFVCPGATAVFALERPAAPLTGHSRIVIAVAMSMAIVVVGGLGLNAAWSLTGPAWASLLATVCIGCTVVGLARRRGDRSADRTGRVLSLRPVRWPIVATVSLLVASCAVLAALTEVSATRAFDTPMIRLSVSPGPARGAGTLVVDNFTPAAERLVLYVEGSDRRLQRAMFTLGPGRQASTYVDPRRAPFVAAVFALRSDLPEAEVTYDAGRSDEHGLRFDSLTSAEESDLRAAAEAGGIRIPARRHSSAGLNVRLSTARPVRLPR